MAHEECFSPVSVCAIRTTLTEDDGTPVTGSSGAYGPGSLVTLAATPNKEEGTRFTQRTGCGDLCVVVPAPCPVVADWSAVITFCEIDYRHLIMLTSGTPITEDGEVIGIDDAGIEAECNRVILEVWTKAWKGRAQLLNDPYPYVRHVFPWYQAARDPITLQEGPIAYAVSGVSSANPNTFNGPFDDWPQPITGPHAEWRDASLPDLVCGYASPGPVS